MRFRILIIDDNPDVHRDFRNALSLQAGEKREGIQGGLADCATHPNAGDAGHYDLDTANQASQAHDSVQVAAADNRPYAVAFLNTQAGINCDGMETVERLCKADADLQFVIFGAGCANKWQSVAQRVSSPDRLIFLNKPFDEVEAAQLAAALCAKWRLARLVKHQSAPCNSNANDPLPQLGSVQQRLMLHVEQTPLAVLEWDLDFHVTGWNPGAERLFGYSAAEVLGKNAVDLIVPADVRAHVRGIRESLASGAGGQRSTNINLTRDGRLITCEWYNTPLLDESGKIVAVASLAHDITARVRQERVDAERRAVLEMIISAEPLQDVLMRVVRLVERQPDHHAAILILQDGALRHAASVNFPMLLRDALNQYGTRVAMQLRISADSDREVFSSDLEHESAWEAVLPAARAHGLRYCDASIIRAAGGDGAGIIMLFRREETHHDPVFQAELMRTAAHLAALTLENRQLNDMLSHQAQHDPLTGLPNRAMLEERLQSAIVDARRYDRMIALCFLDLDRFKLINDTLGHATGDALLLLVAERLRGCVKETDTLVRVGGDEFVVILPGLTKREDAAKIAQRLLDSMRQPFYLAGQELFVAMSVGMSFFPHDGDDSNTLQRQADTAMYASKAQGGSQFQCFAQGMDTTGAERLELEADLRRAVRGNEFKLHFQPQVDPLGNITGCEALLRWNCPGRGMISPVQFIPLAEETGLIIAIGDWVLRDACRCIAAWNRAGLTPIRFGVNVSALQFSQPNFIPRIQDALHSTGADPNQLEMEITESLLMANMEDAAAKLSQLREMGLSVAIDDFGTGHSSLAYLQRLPITTLKVDRSFVRSIDGDGTRTPRPGDTAIINAIAAMARALGLRVVAEGVETERQRQFLESIGCDQMQGFLFSRPVPEVDMEKLLVANRRLIPAAAPAQAAAAVA